MTMGVFVAYANFDEPVFVRGDHPKCAEVLDKIRQSVEICKRVGAKWFTVVPGSVDQQNRDEIAYLQSGDNPGRKEPGTGEMNYTNIFRHVAAASRGLVIGMEHGNSIPGKEGHLALIKAYRTVDPG